ncbi:MAG: isochorismatase family protein, partial [Candidatus Neomarinimicrobiota bacterium]|nr:isochorismatase family protein [Candidatus Neomarinimicrobiota bacterium]
LHILVSGVKLLNIPIIWMEQVPDKLGSTIPEIKDVLIDQKPIIKDVFSCMKNEEFNNQIKRINPNDIILAGIESHVCVYQTAMDLLEKKYNVHIVVDAISSRISENKELGIERMILEGAMQTSVEMLLFEIQGEAKGDRFRQISKLVK